jgi:non-specific serine/threonine protein kinase
VVFSESLAFCREAGDDSGTANALNHLGEVERIGGDYNAARQFYEESLALKRAIGNKRGIAANLSNLGFVRIGQGDYRNAAVFFRESLQMHREVGSKKGISESLAGFAGVAVGEGEPERAARLLGAAEGLLGTLGVRFETAEEIEFESQMKAAKTVLGDARYAVLRAEGGAMTLDQVIDYATDATPASKRRERGLLTHREQQVAGLVAEGLSNRAIATRLGIVERTAISHVEHIMNKLGLHSRAHIAAWAVRHGMDVSAES